LLIIPPPATSCSQSARNPSKSSNT
jgi:hypothetical protein